MTRRRLVVEVLEDRLTPVTMFAVTDANQILTFDSATPGTIATTKTIVGLFANEEIVGIDVRPATGQLYAMGLVDDGATRTARTHLLNPATGLATLVGGGPWTTAYPDNENGGFNFNPNVDLIRIISRQGPNFRVNPNTGALVGTDTNTSSDGLNGVSYTNNDGFAPTTTLFGLDFDLDDLVTVGGLNGTPSPNGGQVNIVGDTGIVAGFAYGFEIVSSGGVAAAFATAQVGATTKLFTANLTTGALTEVGAIGGNPNIRGLTAALNTITVGGTAGNDTVVVTATGPNTGSYTLNGGTPVPFANIESFAFIGGGADDQLQINNPVGTVFAPTNGIIFHGGAGTNTLFNEGGLAAGGEGSYTPSNATDGILFHNNGANQLVTYTGLTTITDTVNDTFGFFVNATTATTINVVDGQVAGLLQVNSGGTPAFPVLNFGIKTPVTVGTGDGGNTITLNFTDATTGMTDLNVLSGFGADTVLVQSTTVATDVSTGDGNDAIRFSAGATLSGGLANGEGDTDTLDYAAYTTPVSVNLGLGVTGLAATLEGSQQVPSNGSAATGTVAITNYDAVNKTFDLTVTVTGLAPADVNGLHIHRGGLGTNGPIILDLLALGMLTPAGTGFTLTLTGLDLDNSLLGGSANEAAFLGGQTYLNIHTAAFPTGAIRGQLFSTGNVNLAGGTATGTGGVTGVEDAESGTAADSLVGSFAANFFDGGAGNDTIVGGPGADTLSGGNEDDTMIWSNGDGSDIMDGGAGTDLVAVNGSVTADDVFTIGANGTRVDFDRVSPGPFSLDIGTTETLRVAGVGGNDKFTVASLSATADLSAVQLFGLAGGDTFDVTPSAVGATANGGFGTDELFITDGGETGEFLTVAADPAGGVTGGITFSNRAPVTFAQIDPAATPSNILTLTATDGLTTTPAGSTVTYTVTVTNNETTGINGIIVTAVVPAVLTGVTWAAAFTGGSSGAANGTGQIAETVSLGAGGTVTFTITGTLPAAFSGDITANATATAPAALTDNNLADNGATDTTTVLPPPTPLVVTGPANGTGLRFAPAGGQYGSPQSFNFFPGFGGETHVAQGDVDGDGVPDIVAATGPGGGLVKVFRGTDGAEIGAFEVFPGYGGGLFVAVGDLNGDGKDDIAVTPDALDAFKGPINRELPVRVFNGANFSLLAAFNGLAGLDGASGEADGTRLGGRPSIADVNGDGLNDLLIAAGTGGGPRITVWNGTGFAGANGGKPTTNPISNLFVFEESQRGGAFVTAGDVSADGVADIIVGGGPGGGPRVRIVSGAKLFSLPNQGVNLDDAVNLTNGLVLNNFFAGSDQSRGGLRVAVVDVDGDGRADLVTGSGTNEASSVRLYNGLALAAKFGQNADPDVAQTLDPFAAAVIPGGVWVG